MTGDSSPDFRVIDIVDHTCGFARGRALGDASGEQVAVSLATYRWLLPELTGRSWPELVADAAAHAEVARRAFPDLAAEVDGIAEAVGAPGVDLWALNARSELMGHAPVGECTTVGRDGVIGQTWDWYVRQLPACVAVRTSRYVTATEGGMPAKIGCNDSGVAVTLNFLTTTVRPTEPGVPIHVLLHAVLEHAHSLDEAIEILVAHPLACSAAVGLSTGNAHAVVELLPGRSSVTHVAAPFAHTNHCMLGSEAVDEPGLLFDNSVQRHVRALDALARGEDVASTLADTTVPGGSDIAVYPGAPPLWQVGTVFGVLIDPARRRLDIAPGRPSETGFRQAVTLARSSR